MRISTRARSGLSILYNLGSKLLTFGLIACVVLVDGSLVRLPPGVLFPAIALLNVLRGSFFSRVSMAIQFSGEALTSVQRVQVRALFKD